MPVYPFGTGRLGNFFPQIVSFSEDLLEFFLRSPHWHDVSLAHPSTPNLPLRRFFVTQIFMKKTITLFILMCLFIPRVATSRITTGNSAHVYIPEGASITLDALTIYHPTTKQCDKAPLITASNSKIDTEQLKNQQLRWMALSRDLLKRWKGEFHYGDTVMVNANDPAIDGIWIVKDTMNKRFKKRGDLLFDQSIRKSGKWRSVEITRVTAVTV